MKKICKVCLMEMDCFNKAGRGGRRYGIKTKRKSNAKTCSTKCAKIYARKMRSEDVKRQRNQ